LISFAAQQKPLKSVASYSKFVAPKKWIKFSFVRCEPAHSVKMHKFTFFVLKHGCHKSYTTLSRTEKESKKLTERERKKGRNLFSSPKKKLSREQSYETILVFKKTKLIINSLTVGYLNLDHSNEVE